MVYISRTFYQRAHAFRTQSTPRSDSLSATLKRTLEFFPEQFFSPPLFYISMPVAWRKISRDKFRIYAIRPRFRNNFLALAPEQKCLRKRRNGERAKRNRAALNSLI